MKRIACVLAALAACICGWAQNPDSLLRTVLTDDQAAREEWIRVSRLRPLPVDSLLAADARLQEVDTRNQIVVFGLLDAHGWPAGLSDEANRAICLVLDHARPSDLKRFMPLVERQARSGIVEGAMYATMLDRMLMHEGQRQRYGTQTVASQVANETGVQGGKCYVWPVEHAASIDSLRAVVGLPPMDAYVRMVAETYSRECVWDPSLGIEDMPVKYPQAEE